MMAAGLPKGFAVMKVLTGCIQLRSEAYVSENGGNLKIDAKYLMTDDKKARQIRP